VHPSANCHLCPQIRTSCRSCKRTTIPGELYADGYRDNETLCHACIAKRNHRLELELEAEEGETD
jgi:hypothetical protein